MSYVNLAFYKFISLENPAQVCQELNDLCVRLEIKGTILLATEGINSCIVGCSESIEKFIQYMNEHRFFCGIEFKKSPSENVPFRKLVVRVDQDLIPMRALPVSPAHSTGKYVEPLELQRWLKEQKDILLVDTRNDYEVALGTFQGALNPHITTFDEFPQWVRDNLSAHKNKTIVTFCTGGIRCEKATAFMQEEGFKDVYQIHGGILKYFEDTAKTQEDNYYQGNCFVFDQRVAVDQTLQPAQYKLCFKCWTPLSEEDLAHPDYQENTYCPHCKEKELAKLAKRHLLMQKNNENAYLVRKERSLKMKAEYENNRST